MANLYESTSTGFFNERKTGRLLYLDGLRGLAIFLVLAEHYFGEIGWFKIGWSGVNLFFILSGYLITGRLFYHDQPGKGHYFRNFYMRRILRIFPLYYGCLVVFFLILPLFYRKYFVFFSGLYNDQMWYWCYLSNWRTIYRYPENITLVTFWSLAVEEQFYLFWPILFRYVKKAGLQVIIFVVILLSIVVRLLTSDHYLAYFSTLTACEPLLGGALICLLEREGRLADLYNYFLWFFLLSIGGLIVVGVHDGNLWSLRSWMVIYGYTPIDGCLLFLLVTCIVPVKGSDIVRRLFSARWLVWLGKYSYGIYVFHFIILWTLVSKAQRLFLERGVNAASAYWLPKLAGLGLVLLMSYASYHWYEQRFLRLKRYFV